MPFEKNDSESSRNMRLTLLYIVNIVFFCISAFCVHQILTYYLGDYYNIISYKNKGRTCNYAWMLAEKKSENFYRKKTLKKYPKCNILYQERVINIGLNIKEKDSCYSSIGNDIIKKYGDIISSYKGIAHSPYICGKRYYDYYREEYDMLDNRSIESWLEFISKGMPSRLKKERRSEPLWSSYPWNYSFTTYKLRTPLFSNEANAVHNFMLNVEESLRLKGFEVYKDKVFGKQAINYYDDTNKEYRKKCILFCNGKIVYLIEAKQGEKDYSEGGEDIEKHMKDILSLFSINDFILIAEAKSKIIIYFFILILSLILPIILQIYFGHKLPKKDNYAFRLFCLISVLAFINVIIAGVQSMMLFTSYSVNSHSAFVMIGTLGSVLTGGFYGRIFFYKKTKQCHVNYFVLPKIIKTGIFDEIKTTMNKRIFITFVGYPISVLPAFPFGVFVYLYDIVALLVVRLALWIYKWLEWVKPAESNQVKQKKKDSVVNYYAILCIRRNASLDEIERAFTYKSAELYQDLGTKKFDKERLEAIQRAYKILKNPEIRDMYDSELEKMQNSPVPSDYTIQNEELIIYINSTHK